MDATPAPPSDVDRHPPALPSRPAWHLILLLLVSALVVLLPMSQLLRPGLCPRVNDWENSLWAAGYIGRYLSVRHALPGVLNGDRFVGNPVPVFYAPLLYPVLGAGGALLGIGTAVRGAAVLVWVLQYVLSYRLLRLVTGCRARAVAGGAMLCWAIYPLTNLYNRGALSEFFGTTFLLCAACAGGLALLEAERRRRVYFAVLCGLCGAAAAGSHAITAVVGGAVLAALAPTALRLGLPIENQQSNIQNATAPSPFRRRLVVAACLALAVAVVVSPWLYATVQFGGRLHVGQAAGVLGWIAEYDTWYVRLSPVPLPTPSGILSVGIRPTPYLDPQLNAAMLVLLLWTLGVAWRTRRVGRVGAALAAIASAGPKTAAKAAPTHSALPLLRSSLALFVVFLLISVVPAVSEQVPRAIGSLIQFAYRLVTYQNLTIFTALVAALLLRRGGRQPSPALHRADAVAWAAALALSAAGLAVKLAHAAATRGPARAEAAWAREPDSFQRVPDSYYARLDYAVADESRRLYNLPADQLVGLKAFALPPGPRFGEPGEAVLDEPAPGWRATDVIAFSWNRLVLDGRVLPPQETRDAPNVLAARVPAGRHTLGYQFEPPATWRVLRVVSLAAGIGWSVLVLVLLPWAFGRRHGRHRTSPGTLAPRSP